MELFVYEEVCKREKDDWWFVGRRKILSTLLEKYLVQRKAKSKNLAIIDIGCGAGDVMELLAKFGQVLGVDSSKQIAAFNKKMGRKVVVGDITKLDFPQKQFSLVTVLEVLEHLDRDRQALEEVWRILKPGGMLVITVPAFSFLWGSHDVTAHHKRRYTQKEIEEKLQKTGFKIIKISYMNTFLFPIIFSVRILKKLFNIGEGKSDFWEYPPFVNQILKQIFSFEATLLKRTSFPFGTSLLVIAEKP